jgi:molybdopterin-guanine dinucleotide biosynthesis protein A
MGRNKALLPFRGATLAEHVASQVRAAAGAVTLVGTPETYTPLGLRVIPDALPGEGPLGGIVTALRDSASEFNLILACDMPAVSAEFLLQLLDEAEARAAGVLLPYTGGGHLEPLCAVWNRRAPPSLEAALARGVRKVTDALTGIPIYTWFVPQLVHFTNVNTPEDWARYARR